MIENKRKTFDYNNIPHLPNELVYIIADFVDYEKYCKPQHYELLKGVINNIGDMASTYNAIQPSLSALIYGNYRVPRIIKSYISPTAPVLGCSYIATKNNIMIQRTGGEVRLIRNTDIGILNLYEKLHSYATRCFKHIMTDLSLHILIILSLLHLILNSN